MELIYRNRVPRLIDGCSFSTRNNVLKTRVRATENHSGPTSNPLYRNRKPYYHPLEEIAESTPQDNGEDAILTAAETARTIIEVNSKAALIFSGLINDEVHESIFWPQLPYVTDEHGGELEKSCLSMKILHYRAFWPFGTDILGCIFLSVK
uniref:Uncharacterized protein n=1 Tax=Nelumbo nucifera TaxID=4432 RepID=A0A822ZPM7_NELNU|nr:TPA_asm: hypothetical protein HUJ06_016784 [Nelumbo nucifera]